jgi:hypothetical protein
LGFPLKKRSRHPDVMKLSDRERKLLVLAFNPASTTGEAMNALRVIFRNWIQKYRDGRELVKDLESGEEKVVYRGGKADIYGAVTLGFGKYKGRPLKDIPIDYLLWVLENFEDLWPSTRRAIEKYPRRGP